MNNGQTLNNLNSNFKSSIIQYGASAIAGIYGATINYDLFKQQNKNLGIQANQIELTAIQQINEMREKFNSSVAQIQYDATGRGIKSTSGNLQKNLENSSKNFSEDAKVIKQNAYMKAETLRKQQSINKRVAKMNMINQIANIDFKLEDGINLNTLKSKESTNLFKGIYNG